MAARLTPSPRLSATIDLGTFLATAAVAFAARWELRDLLWGLWLSSLLVGYSLIGWGIYWSVGFGTRPAAAGNSAVWQALLTVGAVVAALFNLAFFTVHFGGFHLVHGLFLNQFFPLAPGTPEVGGNPFGYLQQLPQALRLGWPLVLGSIVSSRQAFQAARREFKPAVPYLNVIRMHLLIFVLVAARIANFDNRWLYVGILFVYFFPFRAVRELVTGREPPDSA